ncbi:MAG: hypothetical protein ACXWMB_00830 [Candidatus Limnocylindria bacterium]
MPTFENGWICRECWSANREQDMRCYRCHAVPKRYEMPEPITFSTPDGKPNEERKKVTSLTGPQVARPAEAAAPPAPTAPSKPFSERLRELAFIVKVRSAIAAVHGAVTGTFLRLASVVRAVVHAPAAGAHLVSQGVRRVQHRASSGARSALSHRRAWLSVAWVISGLSCALLFSAALRAPFLASLLVVAGVAVFSGLTAAITTSASERQSHRQQERHEQAFVPPAEHAAQPAEILGSRAAH